jgi:putative copper export protein
VHVAAVAFWFGALLPLHAIASAEPAQVAGATIARFSRTALRSVPLIFVCGLLLSVLLIRSFAELRTPYGGIVVGKAVAFGALMALAAANKWRYGPRIAAGDAAAAATFKRTAAAEWALIAAVLVATALLTTLYAPEHLEGSFGPGHEAPAHPGAPQG